MNNQQDLLTRWSRNPIITLDDIPYRCNTVFNGGVVKWNGKYIMLLRVEGLQGHSVIVKCWSEDGYHFTVDTTNGYNVVTFLDLFNKTLLILLLFLLRANHKKIEYDCDSSKKDQVTCPSRASWSLCLQ